jgi:hypothetical protein
VSAGPILGRVHERLADAPVAMSIVNKPTLYKTNWPARGASVRMRTQTHFKKAGQSSSLFCNDYRAGQDAGDRATQIFVDFSQVILERGIEPEDCPHLSQFNAILRAGLPNFEYRHEAILIAYFLPTEIAVHRFKPEEIDWEPGHGPTDSIMVLGETEPGSASCLSSANSLFIAPLPYATHRRLVQPQG